MKFVRPNCERCISSEVCSIKSDVDVFKNDLQSMEFYNGKTYLERLSPLSVQIECRCYLDIDSITKEG